MLGYSRDGKTKIVINRYDRHYPLLLKEVQQEIARQAFWKIPNDFGTTMAAIDRGEVLSVVGNGKEICKSFKELAACFLA
jgi:pilus assembly protein CpaE